MPDKDKDALRRELRKLGSEMARTNELLDRRARFVRDARGNDMTWREIASLLGMSEHGLIKSQKAWEKRNTAENEAG